MRPYNAYDNNAFIIVLSLITVFQPGCRHFPESYQVQLTDSITYMNPVISGFNPDPSVCRVGEEYYLVTSTFEYFPGVPVYHSRDLVNWKHIAYCLTRDSQVDLRNTGFWGGIYAPTLRYHDGMFYMITTNVGGGGNFYVTATDPAGPWSDPVWVDEGWFDPSLFFDDDGKVYYTRRGPTGIVQAEIDIKTGRLNTELIGIAKGMISRDAEGPHLYKFNGWYYLMMAEGGTRALHMETIGRSRNAWGPFNPCPHNPILAQHEGWGNIIRGPGHAELFQAHDGSWWMMFLATRHKNYDALAHMGRESFLVPVAWENGWPVIDKHSLLKLEMNVKTLPLQPVEPEEIRDEFDSETLRLCWMFLRNPVENSWSLSEKPGFLRLYGQPATLREIGSPAFVGRKQTSFDFRAETLIHFNPTSDNQEAGLTVYLNDRHHYEFIIRRQNGARHLSLRKTIGDVVIETNRVSPDPGPVNLRITADHEKYSFQYKTGQTKKYHTLDTGLTQYLGTELASTFTGVFVAMFASGNGELSDCPADFDWFEYEKYWAGPHPDNLSDETFEMVVCTTRKIIDEVKPTRTWFTLEAMPWSFPQSADAYLRLIKAIDRERFGVHLDPVNMVVSPEIYFKNGEMITDCFKKLGPYLKSCHAKDILLREDNYTPHLTEVMPGKGFLNYPVFLRELAKCKNVPLMMEHLQSGEEYRQAAEYIRSVGRNSDIIL